MFLKLSVRHQVSILKIMNINDSFQKTAVCQYTLNCLSFTAGIITGLALWVCDTKPPLSVDNGSPSIPTAGASRPNGELENYTQPPVVCQCVFCELDLPGLVFYLTAKVSPYKNILGQFNLHLSSLKGTFALSRLQIMYLVCVCGLL